MLQTQVQAQSLVDSTIFNQTDHWREQVAGLALDSSGNIYVTGKASETVGRLEACARTGRGEIANHILTDPESNVTSYVHDGNGNLVSVTDARGKITKFTHDAIGNITKIEDPEGYTREFTYNKVGAVTQYKDAAGRVTRIILDDTYFPVEVIDPLGNSQKYTYDDMGNLLALEKGKEPLFAKWTYTHDSMGRTKTSVDPIGRVTSLDYDDFGNLKTMTDADGFVTTYGYDSANRVTSVTDLSGARNSAYDTLGRIISETDVAGNSTSHEYRENGSLIVHTDAEGNTTRDRYDGNGNLITVTDGDGNETHYTYDGSNRIKSMAAPGGETTRYEYDENGNQTAVIDPESNRSEYVYNDRNLTIESKSPSGGVTLTEYDEVGNQIKTTDSDSNITEFVYDDLDRLKKRISPDGGFVTYEYDALNNLTAATDPMGYTTGSEYNLAGQLTASLDPYGNRTAYTYDARGNILTITDALGRTTRNTYDPLGRLTETATPLGRTTAYGYDLRGNRTSLTDPGGHATSYAYDNLNRLEATTDPLGNVSRTVFDARGNRQEAIDRNGNATEFTYDGNGRLEKIIDALGGVRSFAYDDRGNQTKATAPDGRFSASQYDESGRLVAQADSAGNTTRYGYNVAGNLIRKTDPNGNVSSYDYDGNGRLVKVVDAAGGIWLYTYNLNGLLISITDANGNVTRFDYDKLNRRTSITDALGNATRFEYDAVGNRTKLIKPNGETQIFTHDAANRLTKINAGSEAWDFTLDPDDLLVRLTNGTFTTSYQYDNAHRMTNLNYETFGKQLGYAYDAAGNRTQLTREDGSAVAYAYDALSRLTEIEEHNRKYRFAYDPSGRVTQRIYPNAVKSSYEYDTAARLASLQHIHPNGALLNKFLYTYDANGNRISVTDNLGLHAYGYDKLDRLISASFPSGRVKEYSYDGVGNRTRLAEILPVPLAKVRGIDTTGQPPTGAIQQAIDFTYDAADRILTAGERSFVHDSVGRLIEERGPPDRVKTFRYGGFDRPVQIAGLKDSLTDNPLPDSLYAYAPLTPTLDFGPAPLGARIQKTDSQGVTKFLVDNTANVLAELKPDNSVKRQFVHSLDIDDPLAITDEFGQTMFMLPDGLGSVSMLVDREGDPVQLYNYEPFGEPNVTAKDKNSLKFTAREFDTDAALQYNRARFLAHDLGRWTTKDPLRVAQVPTISELQNPQTLNTCAYTANRPTIATDPRGLTLKLSGGRAGREMLLRAMRRATGIPVNLSGDEVVRCGAATGQGSVLARASLLALMDDTRTTEFRIVQNDSRVIVDRFSDFFIDVADLAAFPELPPSDNPRITTRPELVAHFLTEFKIGRLDHDATLGSLLFSFFVESVDPNAIVLPFHKEGIRAQNQYRQSINQAGIVFRQATLDRSGTRVGSTLLTPPGGESVWVLENGDIKDVAFGEQIIRGPP